MLIFSQQTNIVTDKREKTEWNKMKVRQWLEAGRNLEFIGPANHPPNVTDRGLQSSQPTSVSRHAIPPRLVSRKSSGGTHRCRVSPTALSSPCFTYLRFNTARPVRIMSLSLSNEHHERTVLNPRYPWTTLEIPGVSFFSSFC